MYLLFLCTPLARIQSPPTLAQTWLCPLNHPAHSSRPPDLVLTEHTHLGTAGTPLRSRGLLHTLPRFGTVGSSWHAALTEGAEVQERFKAPASSTPAHIPLAKPSTEGWERGVCAGLGGVMEGGLEGGLEGKSVDRQCSRPQAHV